MDHWRSNGPTGPVDQWHSHQDHVGLPQADQGDRLRRHRHLRLPDLADVRRLRRSGQVPGDGPGPRPRADRQHVPRSGLRPAELRSAPPRDAREHPRGLPGHHGPLVGDPARQHHRDARDPLLRHGADHRGQAQAHRRAVEQGRRDHRGPRGTAHLPPRVLLRHPDEPDIDTFYSYTDPDVRLAVRRHGAALHRRASTLWRSTTAHAHRVSGLPLQGHPQRRHRRRPPAPSRLGDHGADHRQVVLRDGHAGRAGRLRGA